MTYHHTKTKWLIGLLVLSLLLGSASVAWAQPSAPGVPAPQLRPALRGEVTGIDASSLTIATLAGEFTLLTDDETRFRAPGVESATVADVQIGDRVVVRGKREQAGILRAQLVFVMPRGAAIIHGTMGQIVDNLLTLIVGKNEIAMLADENTRLFIPGVAEPALGDLVTGARVTAAGFEDDEGNLTARVVRTAPGPEQRLIRGEVLFVGVDGFHLKAQLGELSVQVDDQTEFRIPGVDQPGLNDLTVGAQVLVAGTQNDDDSLLARMVGIVPQPPRRGRLVGQIAQVEGATLTVTLRSGDEINLLTDENTRFLVPGLIAATIADLNVGDTVAAQGSRPASSSMPYAAVVAVLRDPEGKPTALQGELTVIDDETLTVRLRSGDEIQLATDENTQFFVPGVEAAAVTDLNVGDPIGAQMVEREDGSLYASAVGVRSARPKPRQGAVRGEISDINKDSFTLTTQRGDLSVLTGEHTRFFLPDVEDPGIDDLEIGQMIGAAGRWTESGDLQAQVVGKRPGRSYQPPHGIPLP